MLNRLAVVFPEMGYCQGLNFITANLLLILSEKETYNAMYHILYWQEHEKLMSNLDRIHAKLYTLNSSFPDNLRVSKKTFSTTGQSP
jgi:hypothetical protein